MSPMSFTRRVMGTLDESTDSTTVPVLTSISGSGMFIKGNATLYAAQKLVLSQNPCVLFVPDGYPLRAFTNEFVMPGDRTTFNGAQWTVKALLEVIAPDGFVILSKIALGQ